MKTKPLANMLLLLGFIVIAGLMFYYLSEIKGYCLQTVYPNLFN